jgi:hypothetical protein
VAPWEAIVRVTSTDLRGDVVGRHHHTVELAAGGRFVLTEWIDEVDALVQSVRARTAARLVPAAHERLLAGHRESFGAVALTETGIEVDGRALPFGELDMVVVSPAGLQLTRHADVGRPWCAVPLARVPNVHVLFALLHERAPAARIRT